LRVFGDHRTRRSRGSDVRAFEETSMSRQGDSRRAVSHRPWQRSGPLLGAVSAALTAAKRAHCCAQTNTSPAEVRRDEIGRMNGGDARQTDETYDVAISYASEDRPYVQQVAAELVARGIRPFYDQNEEVALWREDLFETLQDVYMSKSHLAVLFISEHYAKKNGHALNGEARSRVHFRSHTRTFFPHISTIQSFPVCLRVSVTKTSRTSHHTSAQPR
jgi:hypothetical protein